MIKHLSVLPKVSVYHIKMIIEYFHPHLILSKTPPIADFYYDLIGNSVT